jgi:hypothetical protein
LLGTPIRVTEILPGRTRTEFAGVRLDDEKAAATVYDEFTPLSATDVGECIRWAAAQPPHVNIDEIVVRPRAQAGIGYVDRGG